MEYGLLLGLLLVGQVHAHAADPGTPEARIIELSRHATSRYCENRATSDGRFFRTHCDFMAQRTADGWEVSGHPILEDQDGAQAIAEGGDVILYFSPSGVLLRSEGAAF